MKTLKQINEVLKSQEVTASYVKPFNAIIRRKLKGYDNKEGFFTDLQHGGCISGMIGDFIYHNNCKKFYIKHINDLENFKSDLEDQLGESIENRDNLPHYTFMVWLAFEEYCNYIHRAVFED